ncbi:helix-hairpin-helix domain-containing protein [Liquorilactobacillus cacaonum]|uniref:ComE operon protein 1 n=1 Tax=Liquorilactobacillus cacaonum DSM 21116 TaxID=1423729 RepID=A0A0R2CHI5_9LACO|nr:helix-hairpin-helix domain-containing protein [Liquorilactobacillus cacaonum]KRM90762.1 ComE operon protein 1 [Liquorilactobacillus cacaonum DSM 21116]
MNKLYELWDENKKLFMIAISVFLVLSGLTIAYFLKFNTIGETKEFNFSLSSSRNNLSSITMSTGYGTSKNSVKKISVDVKGAVKYPGLYTLNNDSRVDEAIKMAGGILENADNNQINLALILKDQSIVYIPFKGEYSNSLLTTVQAETGNSGNSLNESNNSDAQSVSEAGMEKYDINKVTKEELENIPGIGEKKAEQIINYRTEHGRFNQLDELKDISGIGDKTYEKFQMYLKLGS